MQRTPLPSPLIHPSRAGIAVLLSVPHSGREYTQGLIANAERGIAGLQSLEDPLVDRLVWRALSGGLGAVIARAPRAAIDCNRAPEEVDPSVIADAGTEPVGARARGGLGIVPSRSAPHGRLWRRPIDRAELDLRLAEAHHSFHSAVGAELDRLVAAHGHALLLDCHSMPPRRGQAEIVLGDRHGRSAASWLVAEARRLAEQEGWSVAVNQPYAGGYIAERHGQPQRGVHAIQIEIDRSCYLARDQRSPGPGFDRAAQLIERLALGLGESLAAPDTLAAE